MSDTAKKWCPFARVPMMVQMEANNPLSPAPQATRFGLVSANRDAQGGFPPATACIEDACASWSDTEKYCTL